LASCSFDHKVIIWKETSNVWSIIKQYNHDSSVNSISWSSPEFGLCLVAASSDSSISVTTSTDGNKWNTLYIKGAHKIGCNAVHFSPTEHKFVSGGGDNLVKIWSFSNNSKWEEEQTLEGHADWIRDVSWSPNVGLNYETIASCSQDRTVVIWTKGSEDGKWTKKQTLPKFQGTVWKLSWSVTGNILAVSASDNSVSLWKESEDGNYKNISTMK
jgi:protein transport protein SEC13